MGKEKKVDILSLLIPTLENENWVIANNVKFTSVVNLQSNWSFDLIQIVFQQFHHYTKNYLVLFYYSFFLSYLSFLFYFLPIKHMLKILSEKKKKKTYQLRLKIKMILHFYIDIFVFSCSTYSLCFIFLSTK